MDRSDSQVILKGMFLRLADAFFEACKNVGIKGWLWGGTLLGAVREHDQIPYDDDFDVCVMAEDILKLEKANWPSDMVFGPALHSTMYALHLKGTMMINLPDSRWRKWLKIGKPSGVHIDVFPIFRVPDDKDEAKKFQRKADSIPLLEAASRYKDSKYASSLHQQDYHIPYEGFLGDPVKVNFSDRVYVAMRGYDSVLKAMYGSDYMTPRRWKSHHRQVIDLEHGWECYASGDLSLPSNFESHSDKFDAMFINNDDYRGLDSSCIMDNDEYVIHNNVPSSTKGLKVDFMNHISSSKNIIRTSFLKRTKVVNRNIWDAFDFKSVLLFTGYKDRCETMLKELRRVGIDDVYKIWQFPTSLNSKMKSLISGGNCGKECYISSGFAHYRAISTAYNLGCENCLIMEDDIRYLHDTSLLREIIDDLPSDYDIALIDSFKKRGYAPREMRSEFWAKFETARSLACYALSRRAMKMWIEIWEKPFLENSALMVADWYLESRYFPGMNLYRSIPNGAIQMPIGKRNSNGLKRMYAGRELVDEYYG